MKVKCLVFCVYLAAVLASPVFAIQEESAERAETKETASLKKSLFVPGWGQLTEKRYLEGAVFLTAEVLCLYNVFSNNHKGNENYRLYKEADSVEEAVSYRELTETFDRRRNLWILAAVGVWAVNLVDIYVIVKNKEKKKESIGVKIEHGGYKRLAVSVSFRF